MKYSQPVLFLLSVTKALALLLLLFSGPVIADTTYTINKSFTAWFPNKPTYEQWPQGQTGRTLHGFLSEDQSNLIRYVASYGTGKKFTNKSGNALRGYVEGIASTAPGTVRSFRSTTIDGYDSAIFSIYMSYQGQTGWWYGVVSFKSGQFLHWGVQEIIGESTQTAGRMFDKYFRYYSIK